MSRYLFLIKKINAASERNYIKELITGLIVSAGLCMLFHFYMPGAFMLIVGYFCLYQMTCMFENELFFGKKELKIFCIENKLEYSFVYILARIVMDTVLSNSMVFVSISIMLLIRQQYAALLFWATCWLLNLLLAPCSNLVGENLGKHAGQFCSVLLIALFSVLVILYFNEFTGIQALLTGHSYSGSFYALMLCAAIGAGFLGLSSLKKSPGTLLFSNRLMQLIRKFDILVYKDYRLLGGKLLMPVIMSIMLIWLLCSDSSRGLQTAFILLALSSDWMAIREKKAFVLHANDTIFDERIFPEDMELLRRKRTKAILMLVPLKLIICAIAAAICQVISVHMIAYAALIFLNNGLMEHKRIYRHNFLTVLMNETTKYMSCIFAGVALFMNHYHLLVYIFLTVSLLLNLIQNRALCSGADGEEL